MCLEGSVTEILREAGPEVIFFMILPLDSSLTYSSGITRGRYRCQEWAGRPKAW